MTRQQWIEQAEEWQLKIDELLSLESSADHSYLDLLAAKRDACLENATYGTEVEE